MRKMQEATLSCAFIAMALSLSSCGGGGGNGDADVRADPDAVAETATDDVAAEGEPSPDQADGAGDPAAEDAAGEEAAPGRCAGGDTLTLKFSDYDGNPLQGVEVALRCGTDTFEATSDAAGQATFADVDTSPGTIDFTSVYEGYAVTMLGIGGTRTIPSPFSFTRGASTTATTRTMRGDVAHAASGSWVFMIPDGRLTKGDRYEVTAPVGAGLPMSVLEYTTTGAVATPVGYTLAPYDTPALGTDGPDATASAGAVFQTESVTVDYTLAAASPLKQRELAADEATQSTRFYTGLRLFGWDAGDEDNGWICGFTTAWTKGDTSDTIAFAWVPAALAAADLVRGSLTVIDPDFLYGAFYYLKGDPSTWGSIAVHDLPQVPGVAPAITVPFDREFVVNHPAWPGLHTIVSYYVRLSSGSPIFSAPTLWIVVTSPETTSFSFPTLPWPSDVELREVIPSAGTLFLGVQATSFDADPYEGYVNWNDETWGWSDAGPNHFNDVTIDTRYQLGRP